MVFGLILAKNIEIYKCPTLITLLSALGSYWNEYGTLFRSGRQEAGVALVHLLAISFGVNVFIRRACFQNLLHPLLHVTHLQLRSP